jgi:DNA-binding XRE family transcriptional regulator
VIAHACSPGSGEDCRCADWTNRGTLSAYSATTAGQNDLVRHGWPPQVSEIYTIVSGYYSADRSTIRLRMQHGRSNRRVAATTEAIFGRVLREIRRERSLSQEALAFESGYHPTYIGQLERGQKSPSLRAIMKLASALCTPGSEMLRRVETVLARKV